MKQRPHGPTLPLLLSALVLGSAGVACREENEDPPAGDELDDFQGLGGSYTGPPPTELKLRFRSMSVPGGDGATDFVFLPGTQEMLITTTGGNLVHAVLAGSQIRRLGSWRIQEATLTESACGPTNVLLDPEFPENGILYVTYCIDERVTRIARHSWSAGSGLGEMAVVFETVIDDPEDTWHRFGSMDFEPDGETLWVLSGDHFLGAPAQDPSNPFGAVLRIVPNRSPGGAGHGYPAGNLGGDAHPAVYAYGLRSPWRGTRDSRGRLWIAEVGLGKAEEINLLTEAGQNFGWPTHEGPCRDAAAAGEGGAPAVDPCEGFVDPIAWSTRAGDDPYLLDDERATPETRRAIWLGQIYEAPSRDRYAKLMDGVVIFGEFFTGWVRALRVDEDGVVTFDEHVGHLTEVTQWRTGPDGFAYALDIHGTLHRAVLELPEVE